MSNRSRTDVYLLFPFFVTLLMWVVFYLQTRFHLVLQDWGIMPRTLSGITGIITSFFIHGSFNHILSNTVSFFVLSLLLFTGYREVAFRVFFTLFLMTGTLLWIIGRNIENGISIYHIGASGVIFSLFGFLLVSGLIRKNKRMMALSALVIFLYGYLIWGIFPFEKQISWDGHLSGLISGCLTAFIYRAKGSQPDEYSFPEKDEEYLDSLPESEKYWLNAESDKDIGQAVQPSDYNPIILHFDFRLKGENELNKDHEKQ